MELLSWSAEEAVAAIQDIASTPEGKRFLLKAVSLLREAALAKEKLFWIPGWEDKYAVTRGGSVYSYLRNRWLSPEKHKSGHLLLQLCADGQVFREYVHRLVALTFHGPSPFPKAQVLHRDGDATNNHADNLYWGTQQQNMDDAVRHGTLRCGEEINTNKLSEKQVESIYRRLVSGEDGKQIAIELGVSQPAISAIKTKKNWKWLTDRIDNETAIHG
jgi:hypothetical protein